MLSRNEVLGGGELLVVVASEGGGTFGGGMLARRGMFLKGAGLGKAEESSVSSIVTMVPNWGATAGGGEGMVSIGMGFGEVFAVSSGGGGPSGGPILPRSGMFLVGAVSGAGKANPGEAAGAPKSK